MPPQVSILIPCFNRVEYLRDAVDSVLAQSFRDWELIVADDGSGPQTLDYLADLEQRTRARVLRLEHTGNPGIVRNVALKAARGAYVAYLDSDDVWLPTKLDRQLALQRRQPERRWSYVAMDRIHADGRLMRGEPRRPTPEGMIFEPLLRLVAANVSMSSVMAERALLERLGGFDEDLPFFEDLDLMMRLSLASEVAVVREPLVRMRSHAQHYSADRIGMLSGRARLLQKMQAEAQRHGVLAVLRREQRRNNSDLARAFAAAGQRRPALALLGASWRGAWYRGFWWKAWIALARSCAPAGLRHAYRRVRGRA